MFSEFFNRITKKKRFATATVNSIMNSPKTRGRILRYLYLLILILFVVQSFHISLSTKFGIFPDEEYHYSFICYYAHRESLSPFINKQTDSFRMGDITRTPSFFYHYTLGLLSKVSPEFFLQDNGVALRIVNMVIVFIAIIFYIKLLEILTDSIFVKITSLLMLCSTQMFVFLSGAINYDNLVFLLSVLSFYLMFKIIRYFDIMAFLLLVIVWMIGILTKYSFGAIVVAELIVFLMFSRTYFSTLRRNSNKVIVPKRKLLISILITTLVILGSLCVERYIGNIVKYRAITPRCDVLHSYEDCMKNEVFKRGELLNGERISKPDERISLLRYGANWLELMRERIYGIMAHKSMPLNRITGLGVTTFSVIGLFAFIRYSFTKELWKDWTLLFIILVYLFFLFYVQNYKAYLHSGNLASSVQGRYVFPILPLVIFLQQLYTSVLMKWKVLRYVYLVIFVAVLMPAVSISYLHFSTPDWYYHFSGFNQHAKDVIGILIALL